LSVWSKVQTCIWPSWRHCHSLSFASVKSRLVLPFWYRLTWVVLEKGPLIVCVCVRACVSECVHACVCVLMSNVIFFFDLLFIFFFSFSFHYFDVLFYVLQHCVQCRWRYLDYLEGWRNKGEVFTLQGWHVELIGVKFGIHSSGAGVGMCGPQNW